ncbi:MAG: glycerol-3-phosphate dehydrogenase/oxidase [Oceanococcus sp.]
MSERNSTLQQAAEKTWDIVVVGGGITGAGIAREAVELGLSVLLLEQADFASGTSSRSSKLVHGGLRYLSSGQFGLTAESVRERQALLRDAPGLIQTQGFCFPIYTGQKPGLGVTRIGLGLYDAMAKQWRARKLSWQELDDYAPGLSTKDLDGVLYFEDAQTDDARLVLRLLQEARSHGASVLNYVQVKELLRDESEHVIGVQCAAAGQNSSLSIQANVVINATGAWAQALGGELAPKLRPLRGSHLLIKSKRLPLPSALSFLHPQDRRPVFAYDWEGAALLGTTDIDHTDDLGKEPRITADEVQYLLDAARYAWPGLALTTDDVIASYAGVRPVVAGGADKPSDESRESASWQEPGLVSVTGGKLTTFRETAREVLALALNRKVPRRPNIFDPQQTGAERPHACSPEAWVRLQGRFGSALPQVLALAQQGDFSCVAHTPSLWLELRFAAAAESVRHLDDLLLRRTRLGLLLPDACRSQMPRIREVCQQALDWDDRRWGNEEGAWYRRWHESYSLPDVSA